MLHQEFYQHRDRQGQHQLQQQWQQTQTAVVVEGWRLPTHSSNLEVSEKLMHPSAADEITACMFYRQHLFTAAQLMISLCFRLSCCLFQISEFRKCSIPRQISRKRSSALHVRNTGQQEKKRQENRERPAAARFRCLLTFCCSLCDPLLLLFRLSQSRNLLGKKLCQEIRRQSKEVREKKERGDRDAINTRTYISIASVFYAKRCGPWAAFYMSCVPCGMPSMGNPSPPS